MIQRLYNRLLRPYLPRKLGLYNGVVVRHPRLLDRTDVRPYYEHELIRGIEDVVGPDDRVVIVGGGLGVSTVKASRAGAKEVLVYEASEKQFTHLEQTAHLNRIDAALFCQTVGPAIDVWGEETGPDLAPQHLPSCEVLVLDCEGAESKILEQLDPLPSKLVVEAHDATQDVLSHLTDYSTSVTEHATDTGLWEQVDVVVAKDA